MSSSSSSSSSKSSSKGSERDSSTRRNSSARGSAAEFRGSIGAANDGMVSMAPTGNAAGSTADLVASFNQGAGEGAVTDPGDAPPAGPIATNRGSTAAAGGDQTSGTAKKKKTENFLDKKKTPMMRFHAQRVEVRLATNELTIFKEDGRTQLDEVQAGEVVEVQPVDPATSLFQVRVQTVQGYLKSSAKCDPFAETSSQDLIKLPLAITVTLLDDLQNDRKETVQSVARIFLLLFSELADLERELTTLATRLWHMMLFGPLKGTKGAFGTRDQAFKKANPFLLALTQEVYNEIKRALPKVGETFEFQNSKEAVKASISVLLRKDAAHMDGEKRPLDFLSEDIVHKLATLDVVSLETSLQHIEEIHKNEEGPFQPIPFGAAAAGSSTDDSKSTVVQVSKPAPTLEQTVEEMRKAGGHGLFEDGAAPLDPKLRGSDVANRPQNLAQMITKSEDGTHWIFTDRKEAEKEKALAHPQELSLQYLPGKGASNLPELAQVKDADSVVDQSSAGDSSAALLKEEEALLGRQRVKVDADSKLFDETNNLGVDIYGAQKGIVGGSLKDHDAGTLSWLYDNCDWKAAVGDGGDFLYKNPGERFARIKYFKKGETVRQIPTKPKPKKKLNRGEGNKGSMGKDAYSRQPGLQIRDLYKKQQDQEDIGIQVATFARRTQLANTFLEAVHRYFLDDVRRQLCIEQIAALMNHPPHFDGSLPLTHPELVKQEIADDVTHLMKTDGTMKKMIDAIQEGEYEYAELYKAAENLYTLTRTHPKCLAEDVAGALDYCVAECEREITRVEKEAAADRADQSDNEESEVAPIEEILDRIAVYHSDLSEVVVKLGVKGGREDTLSKADVAFQYIAESAVKLVQLLIDERKIGRHTRTSEREFLESALAHVTLKLVVLAAFEHYDTLRHDEYENPRAKVHDQILEAARKRGTDLLTIFRHTFAPEDLNESLFDPIKEKLYLEINDAVFLLYQVSAENSPLPQVVEKLSDRTPLSWRFQADVDILVEAMMFQIEKRVWDETARKSNVVAEFERVLSVLTHRTVCEKPSFYVEAGVGYRPELEKLVKQLELELVPQHAKAVASVVLATVCVHHAQYLERMQSPNVDLVDRVTWTNRYEHTRVATLDTIVAVLAKLVRDLVESMETNPKNKELIENEILTDTVNQPDVAYERAEHLLKFLVWKLQTDLLDAIELGVLEQPQMALVPNPEIVAQEIIAQFASMLEDRLRRLHIRDALLLNSTWHHEFLNDIGVQLRIKGASLWGSIELDPEMMGKDGISPQGRPRPELMDNEGGGDGLSTKPTDSALLTDIMGKAAKQSQTDISCTRGDKLPAEARYLSQGEIGPQEGGGGKGAGGKAEDTDPDAPPAKVSILQSRDNHTVVQVAGDRSMLLEVVGMSQDRHLPRVPGTEPHRTKRDLVMVIPDADKVAKTRDFLELFSSFTDLADALDLLGPEKDNDGTIHENMKIVFVHMDEVLEEGGVVDILCCTGFLQDAEQLLVLEHEMDRDDRLLELLCRTVVDPELGEVMVIECDTAPAKEIQDEKAANNAQTNPETWFKPSRASGVTGDFQTDTLFQHDDVTKLPGKGFELVGPEMSAAHYKQPVEDGDIARHCKVMKPTTSNNVTNMKLQKAIRTKDMISKPDFRTAIEGIADHAVAGVLGERFRPHETLADVLSRAGAWAVVTATEGAAQVVAGDPNAGAKNPEGQEADANMTVLEEIGRFAARQALNSGVLDRSRDDISLAIVGEALLSHARVGAAKFLHGTTEHLKQLGVADLLEHETSVAVKALVVALFGRGALQEFVAGTVQSAPDKDTSYVMEVLERAAMKSVVRRMYWRGEQRLRQRAEYLTNKRHNMESAYRKNMMAAWTDKVEDGELATMKAGLARRDYRGVQMKKDMNSGERKLHRVGEHRNVTSDMLIRNFRLGDHMDVLRPGFGNTTHGTLKCNAKDTQELVHQVVDIAKRLEHDRLHVVCKDFDALAQHMTTQVAAVVLQFCPPDLIERNISLISASKTLFSLGVTVKQPGPESQQWLPIPSVSVALRQVSDIPNRLLPIVETEIDALGAIHDMAAGCAASIIGRGLAFCKFPLSKEAVGTAQSLAGSVITLVERGNAVDGEVLEDFEDLLKASVCDEMSVLQSSRYTQAFVETQCDIIRRTKMENIDLELLRKVEVGARVQKENSILGGQSGKYVKAQLASTDVLVAEALNALSLEIHRSSVLELTNRQLTARWRYAPTKLVCNIQDSIELMAKHPDQMTVEELSKLESNPENDAKRIQNAIIKDVVERRCEVFVQNVGANLLRKPGSDLDHTLVVGFLEKLRAEMPGFKEKVCEFMLKPEVVPHTPDALPNDVTVLANFVLKTLELAKVESRKNNQNDDKVVLDAAEFLAGRILQQLEHEFGSENQLRKVIYELTGILTDGMVVNSRDQEIAEVVVHFVSLLGTRCAQTKYMQPMKADEAVFSRMKQRNRKGLLQLIVKELKNVSSFDGQLITDFCERIVEMMEKEANSDGATYHSGETIEEALLLHSHHVNKEVTHANLASRQMYVVDQVGVFEEFSLLTEDLIEQPGVEATVKQHFVDTVGRRLTENLTMREIRRVNLRDEVINRLSMRGSDKAQKPQHRTMQAAGKLFEQLKNFVLLQLDRIAQMDAYELIFVETQVLAKKIADRMDELMDLGVSNEKILDFIDAMEKDLFLLLENALVEDRPKDRLPKPRAVKSFNIGLSAGAGGGPMSFSNDRPGGAGDNQGNMVAGSMFEGATGPDKRASANFGAGNKFADFETPEQGKLYRGSARQLR